MTQLAHEADADREVSLMAVHQYLREVACVEPLTGEEERVLLQCVHQGRAEDASPCPNQQVLREVQRARARLVEGYQRLVIFIARKWERRFTACRASGMDWLDLVQEANCGLLQAIDNYDLSLDLPLAKLAGRCINNALVEALRDRGFLVRLPKDVHEVLNKMHLAERSLFVQLGREPSRAELAEAMGMCEEKLGEWVELSERSSVLSLQAMLAEEEDAADRVDFVSVFVASMQVDEARQAVLREAIQQAMATVLTARQSQVMSLRYGFDGEADSGRSQGEVSTLMGIHYTSVQRCEYRAKERLRLALASLYAVVQEELVA
jgi:RNA polymerase sigma factor (sigma-70 family)